jgi:hypothetical protein
LVAQHSGLHVRGIRRAYRSRARQSVQDQRAHAANHHLVILAVPLQVGHHANPESPGSAQSDHRGQARSAHEPRPGKARQPEINVQAVHITVVAGQDADAQAAPHTPWERVVQYPGSGGSMRPSPGATCCGSAAACTDLLDCAVEIRMVGAGLSLIVAVAGSLVLYKLAGLW